MASNANQFTLDVSKWLSQVKQDGDKILRKVTLDLFSRVVIRSPVDTGRFRNNWYPSIGAPVSATNESVDPSGSKAIQKIASTVSGAKLGTTIFMTNSLPYAWRLETGWSKQAPAGMVGLSVAEYQPLVNKAAKGTAFG